jgi:hypothetical protein
VIEIEDIEDKEVTECLVALPGLAWPSLVWVAYDLRDFLLRLLLTV